MTAPIGPTPGVVSPLERGDGGIELPGVVNGAGFADLFARALGDASALQADAQAVIAAHLRGEPVELHQVMAASEEAAISLELLVEIRNKLADAYRTIMNLQ
jgi:flagellar hook-basal body complex protein FliE